MGATARHGPHHVAQKSTITGFAFLRTSCSNVASVVTLVAPMRVPSGYGLSGSEASGGGRQARLEVGRGLVHRLVLSRRDSVLEVLERREVVLGVEGRSTSRSGSGDGLPVGVVDEVAAGEHAGYA